MALIAVSAVGYGTAFGYGGSGSHSSGYAPGYGPNITPATPRVGRVLGASTFAFSNYLRSGMSGDAVKSLQERLRAEGFFTYPVSTGYFGPITKTALAAYQKAHRLGAYGILNKATIALMNQ